MTGFFVTGTDTGIGKTVLSALLVAALDGIYWKPIQSGSDQGTDRASVLRWSELHEERAPIERYKLRAPFSPHLAARLEKIHIELETIQFPAEVPDSITRPWIVEGAGGVMVPINERDLMLDVMKRLNLPVIVVARTALGTINHTLLTVSALRAGNLRVHGIVMIGEENIENRRAIEHYGDVRVLGHIPLLPKIDRAALLNVYRNYFDHASFSQ